MVLYISTGTYTPYYRIRVVFVFKISIIYCLLHQQLVGLRFSCPFEFRILLLLLSVDTFIMMTK